MSGVTRAASGGVDIDLGNKCSAIAYGWAKRTFSNRAGTEGMPLQGLDGLFANVVECGGHKLAMAADGIGTKVEVAERVGDFSTLGFDLMAMIVDDLVCVGAEPMTLTNTLDVDVLDERVVDDLMRGLHDAAKVASVAIVGGEIAELGRRIGGWGSGMHFNWCASGVGLVRDQIINGRDIVPGDAVIALRSDGFRSNGFSLLRRVLTDRFGDDWHLATTEEGRSWGRVALTPARIYAPLIRTLRQSGIPLKGIVHVTGGGIGDNLTRILKVARCGAHLPSLFAPHDFMREAQELGNVDEEVAYRNWNMGNGMLLVVPAAQANTTVRVAAGANYFAQIAGEVNSGPDLRFLTQGVRPCELRVGIE